MNDLRENFHIRRVCVLLLLWGFLGALPHAGWAGPLADAGKVGFVGCESGFVCTFRVLGDHPLSGQRIQVEIRGMKTEPLTPDRVAFSKDENAVPILARILSARIHEVKRILLRHLVRRGDGRYLANIVINGEDILAILQRDLNPTPESE